MLLHRSLDTAQNGQREGETLLQIPAPAVFASVGMRREELLQQISVRTVNLDAIETGLDRPARRFTEISDNSGNLFVCQRARNRPLSAARQLSLRHRLH